MKKFLSIFVATMPLLLASTDEVSYNIDYHLKYFYDANKANEIKQIIKKSAEGKCQENEQKELVCKMSEEQFKKIIDQGSIVGLSILEIPIAYGYFGGVGITIGKTIDKKTFEIVKVYKNAPADGVLQNKDVIIEADGVEVKNLTANELIDKLRGQPNTKITLKIQRDKETLTKTLMRNIIKISDEEMVISRDGEHLQLSFEDGFDTKFSDKLARLIFQKPYKKLTLDMRRSFGGNFSEILASLGLFLHGGKELFYTMQGGDKEIQSIPERKKSVKYDDKTHTEIITVLPLFDKEVEIIIDDTTHAGSLLFAYAMKKYYSKCKIIGDKSGKFDYLYGVGKLPKNQNSEDAKVDYLLKYAVGEFYELDGNVLSGKGFFEAISTLR